MSRHVTCWPVPCPYVPTLPTYNNNLYLLLLESELCKDVGHIYTIIRTPLTILYLELFQRLLKTRLENVNSQTKLEILD